MTPVEFMRKWLPRLARSERRRFETEFTAMCNSFLGGTDWVRADERALRPGADLNQRGHNS